MLLLSKGLTLLVVMLEQRISDGICKSKDTTPKCAVAYIAVAVPRVMFLIFFLNWMLQMVVGKAIFRTKL